MTFIKFHEVLSKGSERPEEILKRRDRSLIICLSISNERKTQFFSPWPLILTFLEELSSLPAQDSSQTHNNITREMRKRIISGYTTFFWGQYGWDTLEGGNYYDLIYLNLKHISAY